MREAKKTILRTINAMKSVAINFDDAPGWGEEVFTCYFCCHVL